MNYIVDDVTDLTIGVHPLSAGHREGRPLSPGLTEGLQLTVRHPSFPGFRNGCKLLSQLINSVGSSYSEFMRAGMEEAVGVGSGGLQGGTIRHQVSPASGMDVNSYHS